MKNPSSPSRTTDALHAEFHSASLAYKTVKGHAITCDVLIPKSLVKSTPRPVLIKFHGGGWITGSSKYLAWWAPWAFELALREEAIIVAPNYRLAPEASGTDILDDVDDFWIWMRESLPAYVSSLESSTDVKVDLNRVLVTGDSAGGHLAVMSGLSGSKQRGIRAVIAQYPMLELDNPVFRGEVPDEGRRIISIHSPEAVKQLEEHVAGLTPDSIISEAVPPSRMNFMRAAEQTKKISKFLGESKRIRPFDLVKEMESTDALPPIWVVHGKEDEVVLFEGNVRFATLVNGKGEEKVRIHLVDGAGHGFDNDVSVSLETPWVKEGIKWVVEEWLR
jgi:acetyl esterase/lipase